jgi:hypothetical protein
MTLCIAFDETDLDPILVHEQVQGRNGDNRIALAN